MHVHVSARAARALALFAVSAAPLALASACGGGAPPPPAAPAAPPAASASAAPAAPADTLGPRPIPPPPAAYDPPAPKVVDGPGGAKVWIFERHNLPLVSVAAVAPYGSAAEPEDRAGLAWLAADMLDEGAGKRDAVQLSSALAELGATLHSSADRDASVVSLHALASKLDQALPMLADAIVRPKHAAKDWKRVTSLHENALRARAREPNEIGRVVTTLAFYGADHPYGHPPDGTLKSVAKISLGDVTKWHRRIWRPDTTTFVIVGDVTVEGAQKLLAQAFASWKLPKQPAPPIVDPKAPDLATLRTVVVDRPGAPQVVLSIARAGVSASDPALPRLDLLNVALGGSFTSRLNQNLREDHGWTYGARTRFNLQRGVGVFVARAAIRTDAIAPALGETLKELRTMAQDGPTDDELAKVKANAQAGVLERYASVRGVMGSLASNAGVGLPPGQEARDIEVQRATTRAELAELAKVHLALDRGVVVLVGPKAAAEEALAKNGLPAPELRDEDGNVVKP